MADAINTGVRFYFRCNIGIMPGRFPGGVGFEEAVSDLSLGSLGSSLSPNFASGRLMSIR